jgi:hypothetical protein
MILGLIKLQSAKSPSGFSEFEKILDERYQDYVLHPLTAFESQNWYMAVKPYHAGMFPFMALDLLSTLRGLNCQLMFVHDVLPYSTSGVADVFKDESVTRQLQELCESMNFTETRMVYRGFGGRIDIGLNALSLLYMEILGSMTKVESDVVVLLRKLQYQKYKDPLEVRTFGLQKKVAEGLGKSPVAIHKSLRSAKYHLLAETATSMKNMMT